MLKFGSSGSFLVLFASVLLLITSFCVQADEEYSLDPFACNVPSRSNGTVVLLSSGSGMSASGQLVEEGTIIDLRCKKGFLFSGSAQSQCQSQGRWSPTLGHCVSQYNISVWMTRSRDAALLHTAIKAKNLTAVREIFDGITSQSELHFLIEHQNDDNYGRTPLLEAARYGSLPIVRYMVEHQGADVYRADKDELENTPAHLAAYFNYFDIVVYLLDQEPKLARVRNKKNDTLLFFASMAGNFEIVKYLVENTTTVINVRGQYKRSPLSVAAEFGKIDVVKYLISKGANMTLDDARGSLGTHLAARTGHVDVIDYYLSQRPSLLQYRNKHNNTALFIAAMYGRIDIVKYLVENKTDNINTRGYYGRTPLMVASEKGKLDVVKYLVEKGAALNITDDERNSNAFHMACQFGKLEVAEYLLEKNPAFLNMRNSYNRTPLYIARHYGDDDNPVVSFLVSKGGLET